ncbi:hypothetical protein E4U61_002634 [Claviceps capensis]|nr:hypothetical protein E4U61_002634 [Claviceps capensis]
MSKLAKHVFKHVKHIVKHDKHTAKHLSHFVRHIYGDIRCFSIPVKRTVKHIFKTQSISRAYPKHCTLNGNQPPWYRTSNEDELTDISMSSVRTHHTTKVDINPHLYGIQKLPPPPYTSIQLR